MGWFKSTVVSFFRFPELVVRDTWKINFEMTSAHGFCFNFFDINLDGNLLSDGLCHVHQVLRYPGPKLNGSNMAKPATVGFLERRILQ